MQFRAARARRRLKSAPQAPTTRSPLQPPKMPMTADFSSIHNQREREVCAEILSVVSRQPWLSGQTDLLADIACVALNRLTPHYIRHDVDFAFHRGDPERLESQRLVSEAVEFAFGYVQARSAMRARA
jgi:glutathione S-transferase